MQKKRNTIFYFLFLFTFVMHFSCQKEKIFIEGDENEKTNPADTVIPGDFTIKTVSISDNEINLDWSFSNQAVSYEIALNDSVVAYDITNTYYLLSGLNADTEYNITVNALSATRKKNAQSITVKTRKSLIKAIYTLSLKEYDHNQFMYCIKTTDGGFLLDAYVYRYGEYHQAIMKTDKDLNIIWVNYSAERMTYEKQLLECKSGGYLIISSFEVFKLDRDGQRLWTQKLEPKDGSYEGGIESLDGNIILVGASVKGEGSTLSIDYSVTKLSSAGKIIWTNNERKSSRNSLYKIIQNDKGNYIAIGTAENLLSLLEMDKDGNILWEKNYEIRYPLQENIQATPDGNYFISFTQPIEDQGRSNFAPRFMKVTKEGTVIWDNLYPNLNGGGVFPGIRASEVQQDNSYVVLTVDDRGVGLAKLSPSGDIITHKALYGYPLGIYISAISENKCVFFTENGYFIIVNWDGYTSTN